MRDPEIRKLLRETELSRFINDGESKIVDELDLPVAGARLDLAVLNGNIHGYEIKSASDTLNRLPSQIIAYSKVVDYLSIVTEDNHLEKIKATAPKWVGLFVCRKINDKLSVIQVRKPRLNKLQEGFFIAKLMWREELIDCLTQHNVSFRKKDRNWILCETIASKLDVSQISSITLERLKSRTDWKSVNLKAD